MLAVRVSLVWLNEFGVQSAISDLISLPLLFLLACCDIAGRMARRVRTVAPHGQFWVKLNLNSKLPLFTARGRGKAWYSLSRSEDEAFLCRRNG